MGDIKPARVFAVSRSDTEQGNVVLVHVTTSSQEPLELRLIATEGSSAYTGHMKKNRFEKYKAKSYQGTDAEWQELLRKVFLGTTSDGNDDKTTLEGLETLASVSEEKEITITIRKNIEGIIQRLGSISLECNDAQEIELFEWTAKASQAATARTEEVSSLQKRFRAQDETIKKLNQQLEDLIQAKKEHEDALFEKFRELLNNKKLKIRDQQRLLNAQKTHPEQGAKGKGPSEDAASRKPASSRKGKRKASEDTGNVEHASGSDDDDFEKMDIDGGDKQDEQSEQGKETPDRSDETTDDEEPSAPPQSSGEPNQPPSSQGQTARAPPAPRELLFTKRNSEKRDSASEKDEEAPQSKQTVEGSETEDETDDDEL